MDNTLKILHLEDIYSDAELISKVLKKGNLDFERVVVDTKDKFIAALNEYHPDIILSDHSLPSFNSHEALSILHDTGIRIPFILITAAMSDEFAVNVINRGADDYILKDRLERLPSAIQNSLKKFRLEKERQLFLDKSVKNGKYYRALIENISDAIFLTNEKAELIYQSPSLKKLTGFDFEDLDQRKLFEYIHQDDLQDCLLLFERVGAEPGISIASQFRMLHKNGHYIWTEGTITNLLHDESVNAYIINYRDITERKLAEETLNLSRLYSESIVTTIREPLIILTENLHVRSANQAFYNKFQTTPALTEGILLFDLGNGQWNLPGLRRSLKGMLTGDTNLAGFEVAQEFPVLGERIMLLNASHIDNGNGQEKSILVAIEDVTEQRKIDMELRLFAEKLEKQVLERTFSLHKANIDLVYSNKNLEQFAYVASHDLQEPLRKIKTYSSFLHNNFQDLPPDVKELVTKISGSAERMSTLITELLKFSKILHGDDLFQQVDLNEVMTDISRDFELLVKEKSAVIDWHALPVIEAIPLQINQLFYNLTSNSLKFSNEKTAPLINITAKELQPHELGEYKGLNPKFKYCEISFKDNGIGFEQQFAEKIFLIFHSLNGRGRYAGTGIGLALCKTIAINHHGEIYAVSDMGKGALFKILLPLTQKKDI